MMQTRSLTTRPPSIANLAPRLSPPSAISQLFATQSKIFSAFAPAFRPQKTLPTEPPTRPQDLPFSLLDDLTALLLSLGRVIVTLIAASYRRQKRAADATVLHCKNLEFRTQTLKTGAPRARRNLRWGSGRLASVMLTIG